MSEKQDSRGAGSTREMLAHEALALLRQSPLGRLAVVVAGQPDIFPVNHVVDHGTIVFRTAHGTKLWGAAGQQVAFEVDGYDAASGEAWSVVVHGRGEVLHRTEEMLDALQLDIFPWQSGGKPEFVRIVPLEITGRRFAVRGGTRSSDASVTVLAQEGVMLDVPAPDGGAEPNEDMAH